MTDDILVKNRSHGKQVGKTKVALFNRELADLFIWIADTMNQKQEFATVANNEKMYYALVKRKCPQVAKYVKSKYLQGQVPMLAYYVKYPIFSMRYWTIGSLRNLARYIYRKIYVK